MKPAVFAVSGLKHSGKTTLIERLLPLLTAQGLRVAVLKHDGHRFAPDVPGTDSCRFLQAGAFGAAVFDGEKFMATKMVPVSWETLAQLYPEADLILAEGLKQAPLPRLVLEDGAAVFSDARFSRDDISGIAAHLCALLRAAEGAEAAPPSR